MQQSNSPAEYYGKLEAIDKKTVDDWTSKRAVLLQGMISKSIEDSMKDDPSTERISKPYVKLLVTGFSPRKDSSKAQRNSSQVVIAELKIWRVSDEKFDMVKEGSVIRMKNLVAKSKSKCGMLQLSANHETPMEALPDQPTHEMLVQWGYTRRRPKSLIQINIMAKQQIGNKPSFEHEFDVVACVVKVSKIGENTTILYLTDESGLLVKVKRDHKVENIDPFSFGNARLPAAVVFCNLRIASFDVDENCAVATWELLSCKGNPSMQQRCTDLQLWCTSEDGAVCCNVVLDKINAGIPFGTDHFVKSKVCFGYILSFEGGYGNDVWPQQGVNIIIDYGGNVVVKACLPLHLVHDAIDLFQTNITDNIQGLTGLPLLHQLTRNNQMLLRFVLKESSCYGGKSPVLEVIGLSPAMVDELARLHL